MHTLGGEEPGCLYALLVHASQAGIAFVPLGMGGRVLTGQLVADPGFAHLALEVFVEGAGPGAQVDSAGPGMIGWIRSRKKCRALPSTWRRTTPRSAYPGSRWLGGGAFGQEPAALEAGGDGRVVGQPPVCFLQGHDLVFANPVTE